MTMGLYFTLGVIGFCVVALGMRTGEWLTTRRRAHAPGSIRTGEGLAPAKTLRQRLGAILWAAPKPGDWYCFFSVSELTGQRNGSMDSPEKRVGPDGPRRQKNGPEVRRPRPRLDIS
jgi:hypothetical protein